MNIDSNIKWQIENDINNIENLLSLKPFENISNRYLQKAIFTKIMIDLRDLLEKSRIYAKTKLTFTDDILINPSVDVYDISSLIKYMRDALCHITSDNHKFDKKNNITLTFGVIVGRRNTFIDINGKTIGSDYDDDIGIVFGSQRIYYKRHIIRAFEECKHNFKILLGE